MQTRPDCVGEDAWMRRMRTAACGLIVRRPFAGLALALIAIALVTAPAFALEGGDENPLSTPASADPAANGASEQAAEPEVDRRFASAESTMFTFLTAMNALSNDELDLSPEETRRRWDTAIACLDTSSLDGDDSAGPQRAATDLYKALNRIGKVTREEFAAYAPGVVSVTYFPRAFYEPHEQILEKIGGEPPQIVLRQAEDGRWLFSASTVAQAGALRYAVRELAAQVQVNEEKLEPTEPEPLIRQLAPDALKRELIFDMEWWQLVGLAGVILLGVVLDYTIRFFVRLIVERYLGRRKGEHRETLIATMRPLGLTAAGLVWYYALRLLVLPETAHLVLTTSAKIFLVFSTTWFAWRLVDLISEVLTARALQTRTRFDDVLIPLVRKTIRIFIICIGAIYAAEALNIPWLPLLTSLGIGGVAVAFAAKDTIENFFGSVAVLLDRPFDVGDWVVIGEVEGTVEEVGFRSTRVRTFYNSQVTLPNATLVRATVDNYGRRKYRRWRTTIAVQYDTTPEQLVAFTEGIRELVRTHPYTRKDYFQIYLNEFGSSSLDILLYVFHETPDWSTELRERERLALDIVRLADRLGVQFAFPTQTVHLFQGEKPENPSHEVPKRFTDRRAQINGIREAQGLVKEQPWAEQKPGPVIFQAGPTFVEIDPATGMPKDPDQMIFVEDTKSGS